jgi:hypothetical protein
MLERLRKEALLKGVKLDFVTHVLVNGKNVGITFSSVNELACLSPAITEMAEETLYESVREAIYEAVKKME